MSYKGVVVRGRFTVLVLLLGILFTKPFSGRSATVSLAWDPSSDPEVVAYRVYYGPASGTYTNSVQVGSVTNATIAGLVEGATYYFAATALKSLDVESDFSNETSFTPPAQVNQPPTLDAVANVTINEGAGQQTVNLSGISSGATNETQTLVVTASSSNPGLIPNPTVQYSSPNGTGTLRFTPVALGYGSATMTVTVNDGGTSNNIVTRTFTVRVNRMPIISAITNQVVMVGSAVVPIPFTISDAETAAGSLVLSASSSNQALVSDANIVFGGTGGSRTATITPLTDQTGVADITITVSDGIGNASSTFQFTVERKPPPPSNLRIAQVLP